MLQDLNRQTLSTSDNSLFYALDEIERAESILIDGLVELEAAERSTVEAIVELTVAISKTKRKKSKKT